MDDYAGRVLADRYRLPLPPEDGAGDGHDLTETRAFDTYSGQEVLVRQVPLPEFVDAEVLDGAGPGGPGGFRGGGGRATRRPAEPVVRRAIEAAQAAAQIPDHPLLDQVFDVFAEAGSLWIVSERVAAARPLAALLAERPLNPYRAAEIGADVLTALRALHAHGWVHRNITSRTVLVCDDGRVVLSGLAVGAAEEALCGYAPVPEQDLPDEFAYAPPPPAGVETDEETDPDPYAPDPYGSDSYASDSHGPETYEAETYEPGVYEAETYEPGVYEAGPYEPDADEPETHGAGAYALEPYEPYEPDTYRPEAYEQDTYAPGTYQPEAYAPERYAPEGLTPVEGYGSEEYGSGAAYGSGTYRPEEHRSEPYALEAPGGARQTGDGTDHADSGTDDGADGGADGRAGEGPEAGGSAPGPRPAPDAYGSDPYGKSAAPAAAQPPATPPTADVRAARAGAIAAYRAGARAAARLGETGALPVQRPAPPETPGPPPPPTAQAEGAPEPQWWARVADDEDDEDEGDEPYGGGPRNDPPRAMLTGSWSDGPHASRDGSGPIPAGGGSGPGRGPVLPGSGRPALPAGYRAADPGTGRLPVPVGVPEPRREEPATGPAESYRGPATRLAAERARQTRIAVVGAVTERWAPEQAGPVHENWRLAAPIGPATDLWALGALLYRAVQGHAPYPEDSAAELVQLVCAEPPAFAEESGPLRPVVESLLRQDPTERPDFEELRGWLRSLVRSAPEPEAGVGVVPLPSDGARLPIVRRRGELVRRRRRGEGAGRRRHKRGKDPRAAVRHEPEPARVREYARVPDDFREESDGGYHEELPQRAPRAPRSPRPPRTSSGSSGSPRSLGRTLLLLVFLLLAGAVAYAVLFMPREGEEPAGQGTPTTGPAPVTTAPDDGGDTPAPTTGAPSPTTPPATTRPPADPSAPALASGYALRQDPEGFRIGVPNGWRRSPINDAGQVRYTGGDFTMIVVPGRDGVKDNGADPLAYQNTRERELEPWRASSWAGAERTLRVDIGNTATATGSYWWLDGTGREVFVRNLALIDGGRYHVVQVIGPYTERDKVSEIYEQATKAFRPGR